MNSKKEKGLNEPLTILDLTQRLQSLNLSDKGSSDVIREIFDDLSKVAAATSKEISSFFSDAHSLLEDDILLAIGHCYTSSPHNNVDIRNAMYSSMLKEVKSTLIYKRIDEAYINKQVKAFLEDWNRNLIVDFIDNASMLAWNKTKCFEVEPEQQIAITAYLFFSLSIKTQKPKATWDKEKEVVRSIAEHYAAQKDRLLAKATQGIASDLFGKKWSQGKLNRAVCLYYGATKREQEMLQNIEGLERQNAIILNQNAERQKRIAELEKQSAEQSNRLAELEARCAAAESAKEKAEGKLRFEKNKYDIELEAMKRDVCEELSGKIKLELDDILELTEWIPESNAKQFIRVVAQIKETLDTKDE